MPAAIPIHHAAALAFQCVRSRTNGVKRVETDIRYLAIAAQYIGHAATGIPDHESQAPVAIGTEYVIIERLAGRVVHYRIYPHSRSASSTLYAIPIGRPWTSQVR